HNESLAGGRTQLSQGAGRRCPHILVLVAEGCTEGQDHVVIGQPDGLDAPNRCEALFPPASQFTEEGREGWRRETSQGRELPYCLDADVLVCVKSGPTQCPDDLHGN